MKATLDKASHVYTAGGQSIALSVSQVLSLSGICPPYPESARHFVERAAELGTTVHEWADWCDDPEGDPAATEVLQDSVILPYVYAYQSFREGHNPIWSAIEQPVWDETLGVAGTPDRVGTIEVNSISVPCIVDIKTPKAKQDYWGIQLTGYSVLGQLPKHALYVVWLGSEGTFKLLEYPNTPEVFLGACSVAKWRLANGGKVR